MTRHLLLPLAASSFLLFGAAGCAMENGGDEETEATAGDSQLSEKKQIMLWTTQFPVNPSGTPAAEVPSDVRVMNGCRYTAVTHQVTFQRAVGIKVQGVTKFSCAITNALGGAGYLALGTYPGPAAYARLDTYAALDRIAFTSNGSQGPYGSAGSTMSTLSVKLIQAASGVTTRTTTQGMCGGGPGSQIVPNGAVSVDQATGEFAIGGTKNQPSGLPGDTCIGGGPFLTNFTLHYSGFASGSGPVAQPTIQ